MYRGNIEITLSQSEIRRQMEKKKLIKMLVENGRKKPKINSKKTFKKSIVVAEIVETVSGA